MILNTYKHMASTSFKPKHVTKKLLSPLSGRAKDVITNRFGLSDDATKKTLDAIGKTYGITRERVRQIENFALNAIRKSRQFEEERAVFEELKNTIVKLGAIISEEDVLNHLSKDKLTQNHIYFYLVLGDDFTRHREDDNFKHRWSVSDNVADTVHISLKKLFEALTEDELLAEEDVISKFLYHLGDLAEEYRGKEILRRYLSISKAIDKNQLNEWGRASSSHVKARGIKDYAYLVMRKGGHPMHFKEVAQMITKLFSKKAHVATCHNELIKDKRFVLVGRGIYGLKDWGHTGGIVRDVITRVLNEAKKPLSKDEIISEVSKERIVKPNTILVNLQNGKYFKKTKEGLYKVA